MRIDWWTLGLQTFNAVVLIWILSRFLFRPVTEIMRKRREAMEALLADTEAAKAAAVAAEVQAQSKAEALAGERSALMERAAADARAAGDVLLAAARTEADAIRAEARAANETLKSKEEAATALNAGRLAVNIAAKLFSRLPDEARVAGFVSGLGDGIARLPVETRSSIADDGAPVQLTAARQLTEDETGALSTMFEAALGRKIAFRVDVDPAVIAGLELRSPRALVRNSFRADLEKIEAELMRHE